MIKRAIVWFGDLMAKANKNIQPFTHFPLILIMALLCRSLFAQNPHIEFRHIKDVDGLSQNTAFSIIQDDQGFIWIGTEDGLNKYDGYTFHVYRSNPNDPNTLSYNVITSIFQDKLGFLWIGTDGGGLNQYHQEKNRFKHYENDPDDLLSIGDNHILCLYEDKSGLLWIGTQRGGLNQYDRENDCFIRHQASPDDENSLSCNYVRTIYEDHQGVLWIGTDGGGLNVLDRKTNLFSHYRYDSKDPYSLSSDRVFCVYEDHQGILWIGTVGGGLNRFDRETKRFYHYTNQPNDKTSISHNTVRAIYEDQSGRFWIGTNNGGLNMMDRDKGQFVQIKHDLKYPASLSNDRIYSIFEDASGVIWFGTRGGGINILDPQKKKFIHYKKTLDPNSLSHSTVYAICEDREDVLWIGTLAGLNQFNPVTRQFTHYFHEENNPNSLSNNNIWALCEDHFGYLWVGTSAGLNRYDPKNKIFTHYKAKVNDPTSLSDNSIWVVFEDRSGDLWIGTENGLNQFDRKTEQFTVYLHDTDNPESISHNNVWCILEDHLGNLWIGTEGGGLNCFDRNEKIFRHYTKDAANKKSLASNNIYALYEDSRQILWVGTNNGLHQFDRIHQQFIRVEEKESLPNNVIYAILEDDQGNLWMTTNHGIIKFNPNNLEIRNYDVTDGLQSNEFSFARYKRANGELVFGGINGFNIFQPEQIHDSPFIPPIVITNFRIFNREVPIGKWKNNRTILVKSITETERIQLSYKDREFSFNFAALHFASPDKNEYAYKMEGFDEEWNWVGNQRTASYMNLSPGKYTFHVKGSNSDGVWNEEGTSLKIMIKPPFWETLWFRILVGLCVLLVILGIYEWRTYSYRKKNIELSERVEERTAELQNTMNELEISNEKLIEMTNQLKAVNNELKDFAYIVSHDLKAPLRGVSQIATWLSQDYKDVLDEDGKEQLELLTSRVKRMDDLINGVLQYSRAGQSIERKEVVSLNDMVKEIVDSLVPPKNIKIIIEDQLPSIKGESVKIQQVFQNLISNAIKYNDKKKGLITIGHEEKSKFWKFYIADNGPGIDPKYHDKIFQIFQSLDSFDRKGSTGVGLSVVKKIIKQFGGKVWVESKVGEGSTFYFTLLK